MKTNRTRKEREALHDRVETSLLAFMKEVADQHLAREQFYQDTHDPEGWATYLAEHKRNCRANPALLGFDAMLEHMD